MRSATTDERTVSWPAHLDRMPSDDREPHPGNLSLTCKESFESVVNELERWGATYIQIEAASQHYADRSNIPHQYDKPDNVGVVATFRREGGAADDKHVLACDRWQTQRENARAIALCARRMRLAERCGVATSQSMFASGRLTPTDKGSEAITAPPAGGDGLDEDPHEVLGVAPSAPEDVVTADTRCLAANAHPDHGGDEEEFKPI